MSGRRLWMPIMSARQTWFNCAMDDAESDTNGSLAADTGGLGRHPAARRQMPCPPFADRTRAPPGAARRLDAHQQALAGTVMTLPMR